MNKHERNSKRCSYVILNNGKIIQESNGQIETGPEKLITTKSFQLFEKAMNLVQVTIELDLNPKEAEEIHRLALSMRPRILLMVNQTVN
jgi:hypothetical protein